MKENSGLKGENSVIRRTPTGCVVIRGPLIRGHNDTPCRKSTPGRPIGGLVAALRAYLMFSVTINDLSFNIVRLIVESTQRNNRLLPIVQHGIGGEVRSEGKRWVP
jgi:hypothetical protein